jgi:hypothetical protein
MRRVAFALCLALAAPMAPAGRAQGLDAEALASIQEFAASVCGEYVREGSVEQFEAEGAAKAKLDGLLAKLTNVGIEGAARFDSGQYVGVLREELSGELQSVRACRLQVWNDLKAGVVDAPPPAPVPATVSARDLYPFTATTALGPADLGGYGPAELRIMRNEVYARHGYIFQSDDLRDYFGAMPWYQPQTADADTVWQRMSDLERANVQAIKDAEAAR